MSSDERRGLLYVAVAVFFFSTNPVFVVLADPMHPFFKTWARMIVAALAVGGLALLTWDTSRNQGTTVTADRSRGSSTLRFLLYGLITALHFLFYVSSLSFTTAAHSLSLVYTAPIFVALFSALFLKERLRSRQWAGTGIAVLGVAILAGLEPRM
ncbi:MAG: DMT family transporter, partial [Chloroflexota bacterium]|nr:DMT family transporter [Chloroflexota bacterium]